MNERSIVSIDADLHKWLKDYAEAGETAVEELIDSLVRCYRFDVAYHENPQDYDHVFGVPFKTVEKNENEER